jgi:hypothetical protein
MYNTMFSDNECLIGNVAMDPTLRELLVSLLRYVTDAHFSSIFNAKCLIGHKFADLEAQSNLNHIPFKVFGKDCKPCTAARRMTP